MYRLLYLRLLRFLHDELVQLGLVFRAEVLEGGGRFGGEAEVVHISRVVFLVNRYPLRVFNIRWRGSC